MPPGRPAGGRTGRLGRRGVPHLPEQVDLSRRDSTTWRYDLEPADGGTRVTHPNESTALPLPPMRALYGVLLPHHRGMRPQTLADLEALRDQFNAPAAAPRSTR